MAQRYVTLIIHETNHSGNLLPGVRLDVDARLVFLSNTLLDAVVSLDTTLAQMSSTCKSDAARVPIADVVVSFTNGAQRLFLAQIDALIARVAPLLPSVDSVIRADQRAIGVPRGDAHHQAALAQVSAAVTAPGGPDRVAQARKLDLFSYYAVVAGFLDIPFLTRILTRFMCSRLDDDHGLARWFDIDPALFPRRAPVPLQLPALCAHCANSAAVGTCTQCAAVGYCSAQCFAASAHVQLCSAPWGAAFDFATPLKEGVTKFNFFWGLEDHGGRVGFDATERGLIIKSRTFHGWLDTVSAAETPVRFLALVANETRAIVPFDFFRVITRAIEDVGPGTKVPGVIDAMGKIVHLLDSPDEPDDPDEKPAPHKRHRMRVIMSLADFVLWRMDKDKSDFSQPGPEDVMIASVKRYLDVIDRGDTMVRTHDRYKEMIANAKYHKHVKLAALLASRAPVFDD